MTPTRRVIAFLAVVLSTLGILAGTASAATVPPHTPPGAVVHMRNIWDTPTWYKLQSADPFTGRYGYQPLGNGNVNHVRWTHVTPTTVTGTGEWDYGFMGLCVNGPVAITLNGTGYKYTSISVTLLQYWVTDVHVGNACPPDGHGASHSFSHGHLATNDPTLDLIHF